MSRALLLAAAIGGCRSLVALPPDAPCVDAGYAISRRTFECTGDPDLANARFERYRREYDCLEPPPAPNPDLAFTQIDSGHTAVVVAPEDLYHCSFAISLLACELVESYGDDLDQWLASSDACAWVAAPAEGR